MAEGKNGKTGATSRPDPPGHKAIEGPECTKERKRLRDPPPQPSPARREGVRAGH